jgi:ADP-ribose pyrophosphatase
MSLWKVLQSKELLRLGFFRVKDETCQLPDGRVMPHYYILEFTDWVNVLPVTADGQVIAIEQYRHGSGQTHLEIPGGSLHPGQSEEPRLAAQRELLEETGYASENWISCGFHYPNPALQSNRMHVFLALDCRKVSEPHLDPFEDLSVRTFQLKDFVSQWQSGQISHSLIAASVGLAMAKLRSLGKIPT